jgi:hypothetical protein
VWPRHAHATMEGRGRRGVQHAVGHR